MNKNEIATLKLQLDTIKPQIVAALPPHISYDKFESVLKTALQINPELLNVDRRSLWLASTKAAQDGLLPDGRQGALVIYKDKRRGAIAQWLPMIAGIRQKVRNSGEVATWEVHTVHEKDRFEYQLGDHPRIEHIPHRGADRGQIIAAYSIAVLKGGDISREVMWIDEIEAIREGSRAGNSGPWVSHYGEMAKKTVAKRHAKVLPMSSDLDEMLRAGDEDSEPAAAPGRNLTDALNMIASLPEGKTDVVPEDQTDLIETIDAAEEAAKS
jgi:recombination protein RecT